MYLNENKSITNIDNDFGKKKKRTNYQLIIIFLIGLISAILLIYSIFSLYEPKEYNISLMGDENMTIYLNTNWIEPGFVGYDNKQNNLTNEVVVQNSINTNEVGEYNVTYSLKNISVTRTINVIEKEKNYTYIILKGDKIIYLKPGEKYIEPGYTLYNTSGQINNRKLTINNNININKTGTYFVTYSFVDEDGNTITNERTVIVTNSEATLSLNNYNITNKDVEIIVKIKDNYYDYTILPNNDKETKTSFTYKVSKNGTYKFKTYNKLNNNKEYEITVSNIDTTPPTGSCQGYYKDGKSYITVEANDSSGILNYVINNTTYSNNNITINESLKKVNVKIYDKATNYKEISCNLTNKNTPKPSSSSQSNNTNNNSSNNSNTSSSNWQNIKENYNYSINTGNYYILHTGKRTKAEDNSLSSYEAAGKTGKYYAFECDVYSRNGSYYCLHEASNFDAKTTVTLKQFFDLCKKYHVKGLLDKLSGQKVTDMITFVKNNHLKEETIFQTSSTSNAKKIKEAIPDAEVWKLMSLSTQCLINYDTNTDEIFDGINILELCFDTLISQKNTWNYIQKNSPNISVFSYYASNTYCPKHTGKGNKYCMINKYV